MSKAVGAVLKITTFLSATRATAPCKSGGLVRIRPVNPSLSASSARPGASPQSKKAGPVNPTALSNEAHHKQPAYKAAPGAEISVTGKPGAKAALASRAP